MNHKIIFLTTFAMLHFSVLSFAAQSFYFPISNSSEYFRSTFPSAAAEVLNAIGAVQATEKDSLQKVLSGSLASLMDYCFCNRVGKPRGWKVKQGLESYAGTRGLKIKVLEKCKVSNNTEEILNFEEYQKWADNAEFSLPNRERITSPPPPPPMRRMRWNLRLRRNPFAIKN